MDPFDPGFQGTVESAWQPLLTLGIFAGIGAFFVGALYTAVRRGIKEEGWFKFRKEQEEKNGRS